jgi:hypothetical protein
MGSFAEINGKYIELHANQGISTHEDDEKDQEARVDLLAEFSSVKVQYSGSSPKVKKGLLGSAKTILRDSKSVIKHPRKLKWVFFSTARFENLLVRLKELIDYLHEILDDQQLRAIYKTTQNTYLEMLQIRGTIKELIEAVKPLNFSGLEDADDRAQEDQVLQLAKFKVAAFTLSEEITGGRVVVSEFPRSTFTFDNSNPLEGPVSAALKNGASDKRVWVEWKEIKDPDCEALSGATESLDRIKELAALLSLDKPTEFRAAKCLGYIDGRQDQQAQGQFGMVFEIPQYERARGDPISLLKAIKHHARPSLSNRVCLAHKISSCVFYLHSVNWLHKGLRSQNILCFANASENKLESPYLIGFEYARPARIDEVTEATPVSADRELYRHPNIQGSDAESRQYYRKTFDIYSLGIILLEIALWKSIDEIIGITDIESVSPKVTFGVRESLLQDESSVLKDIRACVGDMFYEAVRACLVGADAFGIGATDQETSAETGAKLQERFRMEVLDKIGSISV